MDGVLPPHIERLRMVIFVAGVHGVGKTHLCQALARKSGLRHASASQLIREVKRSETWKTDKIVTDIEGNQDALTIAVDQIIQKEESLLLDGHFVLKKAFGVLEAIPPSTFERLGLSAIVLIENEPALIAERIYQRDSSTPTDNMEAFIKFERNIALNISLKLEIPFFLMHGPSVDSFASCIESILELSSGK